MPDTVDHVLVRVDPREDRSWLQSAPEVPADNVHALDRALEPNLDTPEHWSAALKRLKPRVLQRLIDAYRRGSPVCRRRNVLASPLGCHGLHAAPCSAPVAACCPKSMPTTWIQLTEW